MTSAVWSEPAYESVSRLVAARTGLTFAATRTADAESGIRRAMSKSGLSQVQRYLEQLEAGALDLDELIAELTVGETYFFREPRQLELIRRDVLPDLLARRGPEHRLRLWSAGCASGEEAYTLAAILDEAALGERAHVLGSDISRPSLRRAREAVYSEWSLRGLDAAVVRRYFQPSGARHALDERIKRRVSFSYLNLAVDTYPSLPSGVWAMDLILCRNVLIYFDRASIQSVAQRLLLSLAPGGWLVTGPSDPPLSELAPFETIVTNEGLFYRRSSSSHRGISFAGVAPSGLPVETTAAAVEPAAAPAEASARPATDTLAAARAALAAGDYDGVVALLASTPGAEAAELSVRATASRDGAEIAVRAAVRAVQRYPLAPALHFLGAMLWLELRRDDDALQAIRRVLYLDRSLAMGHYVHATLLERRGARAAARNAYQTAAELASRCPADELLPLGDGGRAGRLRQAAAAEAALLEETG